MMKMPPFYLVYGKHPHLLSNQNAVLSVEAESAPYNEHSKLLQSDPER